MHSWASRSNERCCDDTSAELRVFRAVRNCPGSNGYVAWRDISAVYASEPARLPEIASEPACNPIVCLREDRRTPANAAHRACECRWPEAGRDGVWVANCSRAGDESPAARTRRRKWSDHWTPADSRTVESVFFRGKLRIVTFFPGLGSAQLDLGALEHLAECLDADRSDDSFFDENIPQLRQRPTGEGLSEQTGWTKSRFDDETALFFAELEGSPNAVLGSQPFETIFVECLDDGAYVGLGKVKSFRDVWDLRSLRRGKDNLRTSHLDPVGIASNQTLQPSAFG